MYTAPLRTRRPAPGRASRFERDLLAFLRALGIAPAPHHPRIRRGGWAVLAGDAPGVSPRIRRVQAYVERHVGEALRLDDLADVAGLSRYHFARVFREEVGQSPWAFVRHARARRAKALLRAGHPPAQAAHEAGFADQSHLTRTLRALDGRTPGAYRRAVGAPRPAGRPAEPPAENSKNVQDR